MNSTASVLFVSVIVDVKSGDAAALRATLHALAAARRTRFELLVDGPAERSAAIDDVLTGFAQKFSRIEHFLYDAPPVERANILLARTAGEFVLFLRAGDRPAAEFLHRCGAENAAGRPADVFYAALAAMPPDGSAITQMHVPQRLDAPLGGRAEFATLLQAQHVSWRGTLLRRTLFDELGPLDSSAPATADWQFLLRIAERNGAFFFAGGIAAFVPDESFSFFEPAEHRAYFDEILDLYERFILPENDAALRGTAGRLCAAVDAHVAQMRAHAPDDVDTALDVRTAILRTRAAEIARMPAHAQSPLISVVLAGAYSPPHILARALDSLAAQTRTDFEIVYVRFGGHDYGAWIQAHPLADRIRYVHVPGAPDLTAARRLGMELTRGAFVAYLDDDHAYKPGHIELLADRALRSGVDLVHGGAGLCIEESREIRGGAVVHRLPGYRNATYASRIATLVPSLTLGGMMHRAKLFPVLEDADATLPLLNDWFAALWLLAASKTSSSFVPEDTYDIYVPLGLRGTELGERGPAAYIQSYDAVCSRVASARAEEQHERANIRERIINHMPQWDARVADSDGLLDVMRAFGEFDDAENAAAA